MAGRMQIFYVGGRGQKTLDLKTDSTTRDLYKAISEKEDVDPDAADMYVVYAGKPIPSPKNDNGKALPLKEYGIKDLSTVHLMLRVRGGINPKNSLRIKKSTLTALPPHISICNEQDMISLDDDPGVRRAKMPCGHVIGPESMTAYALSLLDEDAYKFTCPHIDENGKRCDKVWDYFLVRHVAVLSDEEEKDFETRLNTNLFKIPSVRHCPGCQIPCNRIDSKNPRVICGFCTKKKGELYEFCWYCKEKWKTNNTRSCGNSTCGGKDELLSVLRDCSKKEISGVMGCPTIRACPSCHILTQHGSGCKQVKCESCKTNFCFICLKTKNDRGEWQCGSWNYKCTIANIQDLD